MVRVGVMLPMSLMDRGLEPTRDFLATVRTAGLDHVACGDHVSFFGFGFDGLIQAATLLALHPDLPVHTGIYLLPLRHPVPVAPQLADIARIAPGRLVFGVGIGGEDRHEVEVCGVDPATRGRRMDESLTVLRGLNAGTPLTFQGRHFDVTDVMVLPVPASPAPIVVGGRSDVAVRRAGRLGDGWLGIWNSPRRYAEAIEIAGAAAESAGRADYPARHAMQVWCGFGGSSPEARAALAPAMEAFYGLPFEKFERYCPYGSAQDVAEFLAPYVTAGCREFNLIPQSPDEASVAETAAEVKRLLNA